MKFLATNILVNNKIKTKIQLLLMIFPILLMFSPLLLFFLLETHFYKIVGVYPGDIIEIVSVRDGLPIVFVLIIMLFFMIAGYFSGWLVNAIVINIFFRWTWDEIRRIFLYSEIPISWVVDQSLLYKKKNWSEIRKHGMWKFIFKIGILGWGGAMFFLMTSISIILDGAKASMRYVILSACIWGIVGYLFGFIFWQISELQFRKQIQEKSEEEMPEALL